MYAQVDCKFLNCEGRQFTNDRGEKVDYYRLSVLDKPELNPISLPCTESVHARLQAQDPAKLADMQLFLSITARGNAIRVRVEDFVI